MYKCLNVHLGQGQHLIMSIQIYFKYENLANFCSKANFSCHFLAPRVLLKVVLLVHWLHPIIGVIFQFTYSSMVYLEFTALYSFDKVQYLITSVDYVVTRNICLFFAYKMKKITNLYVAIF